MAQLKNSMQSPKNLDAILNPECSALLRDFPNADARAGELFAMHAKLFADKIEQLTGKKISFVSEEEIRLALRHKLLSMEQDLHRTLPAQDLTHIEGVTLLASHLLNALSHIFKDELFLSEVAIERLLCENPPRALLAHYECDSIVALAKRVPLRIALSVTRHTENDVWQNKYLTLLRGCGGHDFELRSIATCVIDTQEFLPMMKEANKLIKPWRMSHAKETGMVTFFTSTKGEDSPVSLLIRILVFLHYIYEVRYTGEFLSIQMKSVKQLGERLVDVILNHRDSFSTFTTPNVYDENLYWKKALDTFGEVFPLKDFSFFKDTISLGGFLAQNSNLISLNMIDALWDIGLSDSDTSAYFGKKREYFLYHMQEAFWYESLRHILDIPPEEMESLVISSLNIGDITFTTSLIETEISNFQKH